MTAPLRTAIHSSTLPTSQNTAPVAEFRCLYTHDLRRKQKRWQDGYLKFHSFNSRVMVYDQSRIFLGDTYWKDVGALGEGDELTLDKGVMVEVAEPMGVTQTDLNPLFEKAKAPSPAITAPAPPRRFQPPSQVAPNTVVRANPQMRHKSLTSLLGNSKGPIGKAMPIVPPYEARRQQENDARIQQEQTQREQLERHRRDNERKARKEEEARARRERDKENEWVVQREAKRQKVAHQIANRKTDRSLPLKAPTIPRGTEIISLDCETDVAHPSSPITLPGTPPLEDRPVPSLPTTLAPAVETPRPKIPRGKVPVPSVKALETPRQPPPPSSPPVSAANRLSNVEFAMSIEKPKSLPMSRKEPAQKKTKEMAQVRASVTAKELTDVLLREETSAKEEPTVGSGQIQLSNDAQEPPRDTSQGPTVSSVRPAFPIRNPKARALRLSTGVKRNKLMCQAPPPQFARDTSEARPPALKSRRKSDHGTVSMASEPEKERSASRLSSTISKRKRNEITGAAGDTSKRTRATPVLREETLEFADDADVLGMLDQQLLISPGSSVEGNSILKTLDEYRQNLEPIPGHQCSPQREREKQSKTNRPQPPVKTSEPVSQPAAKLPFSTGGFPKKPKQNRQPPTEPSTTTTSPFTTETATTTNPRPNPTPNWTSASAISTSVPTTNPPNRVRTTSRNLRRVRSENDAPIPNTTNEWVEANLPEQDNAPSMNTTNETATTATAAALPAPKTATTTASAPRKPARGGHSDPVKRTNPRRRMGRTQSLNEPEPVDEARCLVADTDVGPWSTEAFDLFDWRRPGV